MKKTWLNSKEPMPKWVGVIAVMLVPLFIALLVSDGDLEFGMYVFCVVILFFGFLYLVGYGLTNRIQKVIKDIGKERYEEIKKEEALVNIIEAELLDIPSSSRQNRMHLNPPNIKFTGKVKEFWDKEKKKIRYELSFRDGQEHGLWKGWYLNGQLGYERQYKVEDSYGSLGKIHGKTKVWDKSGKLRVTLSYDKGVLLYK